MISETVKFSYMYYIFGDDKNMNVYDGKMKFKKKKAFLKTFSINLAFNEFKKLIKEKVFKNIYLILDLADSPKFESYFDKYDSTIKFICISAHSFDDYKLSVDKTFRMNKERYYYFSNKFDLMKDIDSNIGKDDNEYFISFSINEAKCTRKFVQKDSKTRLNSIHEQDLFWKKINNQKGGFIIDLSNYKSLQPKKNLQIITIAKDKEKASVIKDCIYVEPKKNLLTIEKDKEKLH